MGIRAIFARDGNSLYLTHTDSDPEPDDDGPVIPDADKHDDSKKDPAITAAPEAVSPYAGWAF